MSGIKYYQLGDGEELPEEFCAIRNVNGEPDEYAWYEPMDSFDRELWGIFKDNDWVVASEYRKLMAENAKLREERGYYKAMWEHATVTDCELRRVRAAWKEDRERTDKLRELVADMWHEGMCECGSLGKCATCMYEYPTRMRELGIEVDDG